MNLKPLIAFTASFSMLVVTLPIVPAFAGGSSYGGGGMSHGGGGYGNMGGCKNGMNKNVYINKNMNYNNNININKNLNINKNININKNVNINKNINDNKNININKNIVIVKSSANAEAAAFAAAAASANSSSRSQAFSSSGSYSESTVINHGGGGGEVAVSTEQTCHMQEASVVKAIHAVCVAEGREFAASHMLRDTWIDSSYEGEVARCIPGATLKVVIGDMVQSDQGMAGSYENGQVLSCGPGEAVRHYKDGMLKCAPAVPVRDCTERTNLRLYGTGDFFFSYRTQVCATSARSAEESTSSTEVSGMSLDGGVGPNSY